MITQILLSIYFVFSIGTMSLITLISPRLSALDNLEKKEEFLKNEADVQDSLGKDKESFGLNSTVFKCFVLFYIFNSVVYGIIFGIHGFVMLAVHAVTLLISQFLGRHLRIIGITGQISSGKSEFSKYLREHHKCTVIDIDLINREVLEFEEVKREIRERLGDSCFNEDGALNKLEIRKIIYSDPLKKRQMEKITHMRVLKIFIKRVLYLKLIKWEKYVFIENSILLKLNFLVKICYPIISIVCLNQSILINRIRNRDNCSEEDAQKVLSNQFTAKEYMIRSDYIINNEGSIDDLKIKADEFINDLKGVQVKQKSS